MVSSWGTGRPDYLREIWRGKERPGTEVLSDEKIKDFSVTFTDVWYIPSVLFSPYSWVKTPLSSGSTQNFIDAETGTEMPYTVAMGYELETTEVYYTVNQPAEIRAYVNGAINSVGHVDAFSPHLAKPIISLTLKSTESSGEMTIRYEIKNLGVDSLRGNVTFRAILRKY